MFLVNMTCAQRIMGALHPVTGRSKPVRYAFIAYYASIFVVLVMVIATTIQSFQTTNPSTLKTDMNVRKFCGVWMSLFAFSPIPITLIAFFTPSGSQPTKLGTGSMNTKVAIVCGVSVLLTLGVAFRTSVVFLPTRPITDPAWYHKRPAFYTFSPMLELIAVTTLAALRFDHRFYLDGKAEKEREQGMGMSTEYK